MDFYKGQRVTVRAENGRRDKAVVVRVHEGFVVVRRDVDPRGFTQAYMTDQVSAVDTCSDCGDPRGDGHEGCPAWSDGGSRDGEYGP